MTRVAVIGNAGGGKSTMCRALSTALGLPHHAVDLIQWRPGWNPVPPDEFNRKHDDPMRQPKWIIDGFGTWESIERRFGAADTIIFVDLSQWLHYWWATKRQFIALVCGRSDGPEGCPMLPVTLRLYRMMWSVHREIRPRVLALLDRYRPSAQVIHIRSKKELSAFIHNSTT